MDHEQAVREGAIERYLLDELSPEEAERFEEHYFDCVECASELKATAQFLERTRTELRRSRMRSISDEPQRVERSWRDFFRSPALLAPAMALLLVIVVYQNTALLPRLEREAALQRGPEILRPLSLIGMGSRGGSRPSATVGSHQALLLSLDILAVDDSSNYVCLLLSESGQVLWRLPVSSAQARDTVQIRVPGADLASGQYMLVVRRSGGPGDGDELSRYPFNITRLD